MARPPRPSTLGPAHPRPTVAVPCAVRLGLRSAPLSSAPENYHLLHAHHVLDVALLMEVPPALARLEHGDRHALHVLLHSKVGERLGLVFDNLALVHELDPRLDPVVPVRQPVLELPERLRRRPPHQHVGPLRLRQVDRNLGQPLERALGQRQSTRRPPLDSNVRRHVLDRHLRILNLSGLNAAANGERPAHELRPHEGAGGASLDADERSHGDQEA
mmetsp:Transcript_34639/g.92121  ORF Transcript_34639/g.92121 Transcript_34639/m.92121 type:complete len:217 (-) Transcript_34639:67-717(-)